MSNDDIILVLNYKFTSTHITLQDWIDNELYKNSRRFILSVQDKDGNPLPRNTIPSEYENRPPDYYREGTLWYKLLMRLGWVSKTEV